jgi:hypothetical protein
LILTPVKNAEHHLDRHFESLAQLDYPKLAASLGLFLESNHLLFALLRDEEWVLCWGMPPLEIVHKNE